VRVLVVAVMVNVLEFAVAAANPPPEVILAEISQLPESTKVTAPDPLIVHTEVVKELNDFVPLPAPALSVAVKLGGVARKP
jgi:hypothetical protein